MSLLCFSVGVALGERGETAAGTRLDSLQVLVSHMPRKLYYEYAAYTACRRGAPIASNLGEHVGEVRSRLRRPTWRRLRLGPTPPLKQRR